jgi:hypothetical protein
VTWPEDKSPFPERILFLASKVLWEESLRDTVHRPEQDTMPFSEGAVAGVFEVRGWTNLHGRGAVRIPNEFQVVRYRPLPDKRSPVVAEVFSCWVTAVGALRERVVPIPLTERYVDVLDGRFRDAQYPQLCVTYHITNQTWKSTNDADVIRLVSFYQKEYAEVRNNAPRFRKAFPVKPSPLMQAIVTFLCISVALSLPVALGLRWQRSRRQGHRD